MDASSSSKEDMKVGINGHLSTILFLQIKTQKP